MPSSGERRERISESLLVAAGVRRDGTVRATTQLARLPVAVRDEARRTLGAWHGGGYRGTDLSASSTRRRRLTHARRAVLAATGTPIGRQPASAAAVDRAWRALDPVARDLATAAVAVLGPAPDLAAIRPVVPDALEDFLAGPSLLSRPLVEARGPSVPGVPTMALLSERELDAFLDGDGLDDVVGVTGPGGGAGHWWKGGPGFDDPEELRAWIEAEGFDWVAIAEVAFDGEEWRVWFPEHSP